jgi:uncharacterized protein YggT (Ycf19 family)
MSKDLNLVKDEARRRTQHEQVKGLAGSEVQAEIVRSADRITPDDQEKAEQVGNDLKRRAIGEVTEAEAEIHRGRIFARVKQVVDFIFYVVYGLIGLQILLEVVGAREGAWFKQLMNAVTYPLLGPFRHLVTDLSIGRFQFMLSYVVGLVVYIFLHVAIRGLIRILARRSTSL